MKRRSQRREKTQNSTLFPKKQGSGRLFTPPHTPPAITITSIIWPLPTPKGGHRHPRGCCPPGRRAPPGRRKRESWAEKFGLTRREAAVAAGATTGWPAGWWRQGLGSSRPGGEMAARAHHTERLPQHGVGRDWQCHRGHQGLRGWGCRRQCSGCESLRG